MPERLNVNHDGNKTQTSNGKELPQVVASLLATLAIFSAGTYLSWTSPALPLFNRNGTLVVHADEGSWIGSMVPLGALAGAIPAGFLADKIGRKTSILIATVPLLLCWCVIGFAPNVICLCIGRFIAGVASGAATVVVPVYISEIAEMRIRGSLGSLFQLQITIGILFAYVTGYTGNLVWIAIMCSTVPAILLVTFPFMPESPVWLVAQNRRDEAKSAIRRLRGARYDAEYELSRLEQSQHSQGEKVGVTELLHHKMGLLIALGLMVFQQLSGVNTIIFYSESMFIAAGSKLDSTTCPVIVGVVQVIATYASTMLVDRTGRKILLMISSSVMALCLFTLASYFYFLEHYDLSVISWVPLVAVGVFIVIFSVGYGPIPWIIIGEIFPSNVKGIASSATAACNWTLAFLVTKVFQNMIDVLGMSASFGVFVVICTIGTLFVFTIVPETKGKTIEEVQVALYGEKASTGRTRALASNAEKCATDPRDNCERIEWHTVPPQGTNFSQRENSNDNVPGELQEREHSPNK